jgi:hypothetical protein
VAVCAVDMDAGGINAADTLAMKSRRVYGVTNKRDKCSIRHVAVFIRCHIFSQRGCRNHAWLQWRVAHNKLRLDLFDRRYKICKATARFVRASLEEHARLDHHLNAFNDETSHAEFLFGNDVVNYLDHIRQLAQKSDVNWLSDPDRIIAMTRIFLPYLGFRNVKV